MNETVRMWVEVCFNITYLIVVWYLVVSMAVRFKSTKMEDRTVSKGFLWAFALLALGDTGHVGFRVAAYGLGDLYTKVMLFGKQLTLIGIGSLMTAITITLFYVLMLGIWRNRFRKAYGWFEYLLIAAAVIRLLIFVFPGNQWGSGTTPQDWSLYRNIPLMIQGLGVAWLILRDGLAAKDRPFKLIGSMILVSYACYMPVILVRGIPMLGMLMIPKTLAYLAIAIIAYRAFFSKKDLGAKKTLKQNIKA